MNGLNDQSILDVRKLISGKDGQLYVTDPEGNDIFLAEVDTFQVQLSPTNVDYQPVGSSLIYAVNTGYSLTLTLTEAVVRDDVMLSSLIQNIRVGYFPGFDFTGKLRRRDGEVERIVYRNCVPDGTIDLQNLTPGEIIKRTWSFRINASPEMIEKFGDAAAAAEAGQEAANAAEAAGNG